MTVTADKAAPAGPPPPPGFGADTPPETSPAAAVVPYLRAIRARLVLVVAIVVLALGGAVAWLVLTSPTYSASAQILVTPLPDDKRSLVGLPLIRAVGANPARPVDTAVALVDTPRTAELAAERLGGEVDRTELEDAVSVQPLGESSIVEVEAMAGSGSRAAELANAFARGALDARRDELRPLVTAEIAATRRELRSLANPRSATAEELRARFADLRAIQDGTDPTLAVTRVATPPSSPDEPPPGLVLPAALLAGLAIGCVTVVLMELLAPREVKDESDLADAYPLPILARIPFVRPGTRSGDRRVTRSRAAIREGFRSLRGRLEYRGGTNPVGDAGDGRRPAGVGILFTSGSRGDGRTSSALNLAYVAAGAGQSVIVIDLDFPNPEAAELLGAEPEHDLRRLLADHARIDDALTEVPFIPGVQVLAAPPDPDLVTAERLNRRVGWIIAEARKEADWVIVDAPPLGGESDALAAVEAVDDVVVVARLGRTRQAGLIHLRDLLEPGGTVPAGYLVIGRAPPGYYGYPGREG